ncbi:MAG: hypothetical protein GF341_01450, partial [candidate division Zixibacteria bacterium]|nr:hypothetical protein [candidate division Zixibacteria bacterium]
MKRPPRESVNWIHEDDKSGSLQMSNCQRLARFSPYLLPKLRGQQHSETDLYQQGRFMAATLEQLKALAKKTKAEFIDLKFCDLVGSWHHITLPIAALSKDFLTAGVGVDGSSLPGFASIERGDLIALPDADTAFIDPFFDRPTVSLIADIMDAVDEVTTYSRNPRRVAADATNYLKRVVKGADALFGPEFEFYIFDSVSFSQGPDHAYYYLDSIEAPWGAAKNGESLGYKIPYKGGYHIAPPRDRRFNLRSEIATLLAEAGVGLKYHHHEVGGGGQHEFETEFAPMPRVADQTILVKYFIKNACFRAGMSATFMPKPLFNEPGSGMHVHQYLANAGGSLFYKKGGTCDFSEIGLHYIGGLLAHADSLLAFTNPSTNSYKRLVPGFEAPVAGT